MHKRVGSTQAPAVAASARERSAGPRQSAFGNSGLLNVANEKYLAIIYQYVRPEHAWKILKWLNTISDDNKKVSSPASLLIII